MSGGFTHPAAVIAAFALILAVPAQGADTFGHGTVLVPTTVSGGTGTVADLQTDNDTRYVVPKGATVTIGGFGGHAGPISSVHIFAQYSVEPGYGGTNALRVNGLATPLVPADRDYGRWAHVDVTGGSFGIDTSAEIESLSVTFTNNDTAAGDAVLLDCVYVVVNPQASFPILPTWCEDFNGSGAADPLVWEYEMGYQRNNELQYYVPGAANGWREGGNFIIEGRRESIYSGHDYTSASILTRNKFYWRYGRAQIRARIPCLPGLWPAIWGTGEDGQWPHNGEVDIMEYYGDKILANCAVGTSQQWTAKWDGSNRSMGSLTAVDPDWKTQWHIWTIQWDEQNVRLYADNILMNTIPQSWLKNQDGYNTSWGPQYPFTQPFTCWLNLAIGGNAGGNPSGTAFPQRYLIDYWKIWEGATGNVAPTGIALDSAEVPEGLPAGTVVGTLAAADADPAEVLRYTLVAGAGDTHNSQFTIPEFVSDNTLTGLLRTAQVLDHADGPTRSVRVRVTDIEGATHEEVLTIIVPGDPEIEVSPESLAVPEGGTNTFQVRLRTLPAGTITVDVSRQSGDPDLTVGSGATLTFTPTDGTDWQTVTLAAAEDADRTNGTATILCSDPGGIYGSATLPATEADNDNLAPLVTAPADQTLHLASGPGGGAPVTGAWFEWDAAADDHGNNVWTSVAGYNWVFDNGSRTPGGVADPRFGTLSHAYDFPESKDTTNTSFHGAGHNEPAVFEFVLDVDGPDGSVFETGGSGDGLQIDLVGGVLRGTVQENPPARVSYPLTAEDLDRFLHVVFLADSANDVVELYVDGDLKGSVPWTQSAWAGTDSASLGSTSGTMPTGGASGDFDGKIALFRYYRNTTFDAADVTTNFDSLFVGDAVTTVLDASVSDPEGDPLTTTWSLVSGPAGVTFGDASAVDTTVTFTAAGSYLLRLTADDGVDSSQAEVAITVGAPSPYGNWAAGPFAHPLALPALTADPEGDAFSSLLEFAFGTDPTVADNWPLAYTPGGDVTQTGAPITVNFAGPGETPEYHVVFIRRKDHATAGLTYRVDFTADLSQWTAATATPTVLTGPASAGDHEAVSVPYPPAIPANGGSESRPPGFFRVAVTAD